MYLRVRSSINTFLLFFITPQQFYCNNLLRLILYINETTVLCTLLNRLFPLKQDFHLKILRDYTTIAYITDRYT